MTNYAVGHEAEVHAAEYLQDRGYEILELNWKTRYCEIDIVARQGNAIYFTEVKYREHHGQGGGLDYITPKKLKQMSYAAEIWAQNHSWQGEYSLAAIELTGETFQVTAFLPEL